MRRYLAMSALALAFTLLLAGGAYGQSELYLYPDYNEFRDPKANLAEGAARARAEGKRVLIEVGGDWCAWCHILDGYLAKNTVARDAFSQSFVIVKVNYSQRQKNKAFLSQYPKIWAYPAFIVVDADGKLLGTQSTGELELNQTYSQKRMVAFAERWRAK